MSNKLTILQGDARETLSQIESGSVNTCVTSPPYFGLRDYGCDGQIGLEQTPEAYIAELVSVFRGVRRCLRDDGTLWLNVGDSYNAQPGQRKTTDKAGPKQSTSVGSVGAPSRSVDGLKPKDLIGIPWMLAFALRADGWYLRSDIIWAKPNPMPESVTDRPTKSHEYLFLLSKSERYYYDHEAIKEPLESSSIKRLQQPNFDNQTGGPKDYANGVNANRSARRALVNLKGRAMPPQVSDSPEQWAALTGRNKRSVWNVPTRSYKDAHFATYPPELIKPCILAGCPAGGLVLDPFGGSGTTAMVAMMYGRRAILCELNPEYIELARRRCLSAEAQEILAL